MSVETMEKEIEDYPEPIPPTYEEMEDMANEYDKKLEIEKELRDEHNKIEIGGKDESSNIRTTTEESNISSNE